MSDHNGCRGILIGLLISALIWVGIFIAYKAYASAHEPETRRCLIHDTIRDC